MHRGRALGVDGSVVPGLPIGSSAKEEEEDHHGVPCIIACIVEIIDVLLAGDAEGSHALLQGGSLGRLSHVLGKHQLGVKDLELNAIRDGISGLLQKLNIRCNVVSDQDGCGTTQVLEEEFGYFLHG